MLGGSRALWRASTREAAMAAAEAGARLFGVEHGSGGAPVVLLHGFGGSHAAWGAVVNRLGGARHTIAFDLPGHAGSLACPTGGAGVAARAVLAELDRRGVAEAHLVGHSMGGAAAALAALRDPPRIASLTLFAPGGFGSEINHRLLRRFAAAREESELALILEQFFGWDRPLPEGLAAEMAKQRQVEGAVEALEKIVETFFDDGSQKVIPRAELKRLAMPTKVVWGTQDRVLPTRQAHRLPGHIAVHIFEEAGHMLTYEIPDEAAGLILENTR
jgi:pyruvate dehydrogenase E2 component (dihydrolipoamide acetyltransferase)